MPDDKILKCICKILTILLVINLFYKLIIRSYLTFVLGRLFKWCCNSMELSNGISWWQRIPIIEKFVWQILDRFQ